VNVAESGLYTMDILYTSNRGGVISLDVNGNPAGKPIQIASTKNVADPIAWRQWHHWNLARNAARIQLAKGLNLLTLHIVEQGNMNLATLTFRRS
jgi:hypothetical protein